MGRPNDSEAYNPRYVYPSITNVNGSTISKKPWAQGYHNGWGGWPHGAYGNGYGHGYNGNYGYGNHWGHGGFG